MLRSERGGAAQFVLVLAVVVVLGIPMFGYVWETINRALSGEASVARLAITVPLVLGLVAVLWGGGRAFQKVVPEPAAPEEGVEGEPNVSGTVLITTFILVIIFGGWTVGYFFLMNR
jgi:hypothetical protein